MILERIVLLLINKPTPSKNKSQSWWDYSTILKLLSSCSKTSLIPYFIESCFSVFDSKKAFNKTLIMSNTNEHIIHAKNASFLKDVLNSFNEISSTVELQIITTPLVRCFLTLPAASVTVGQTVTIRIEVLSHLPPIPLHSVTVHWSDETAPAIRLPTPSVQLPHELASSLVLSIPYVVRKPGVLVVHDIVITTHQEKGIQLVIPYDDLVISKDALLDCMSIGRICTDYTPPTRLVISQRIPSVTVSLNHSNPVLYGEKLPVLMTIFNKEHYSLSCVVINVHSDVAIVTTDVHSAEQVKSVSCPTVGVEQKVESLFFLQFTKAGKIELQFALHYTGVTGAMSLTHTAHFDVVVPLEWSHQFISNKGLKTTSSNLLNVSLNNRCDIPLIIDQVLLPTPVPLINQPLVLQREHPCEVCAVIPQAMKTSCTVLWHRQVPCEGASDIITGRTTFDIVGTKAPQDPLVLTVQAPSVVSVGEVFSVTALIENNTIVPVTVNLKISKDFLFTIAGTTSTMITIPAEGRYEISYELICLVPGQHNTPSIIVENDSRFITQNQLIHVLPTCQEKLVLEPTYVINMP